MDLMYSAMEINSEDFDYNSVIIDNIMRLSAYKKIENMNCKTDARTFLYTIEEFSNSQSFLNISRAIKDSD